MTKKELLRGLPKIDEVLKQESLVVLSEEKGDLMVTEAVRAVIAGLRASILDLSDKKAEEFDASALEIEAVAEATEAKVLRDEELNLYPLINATGTILHTNLGRAPLCRDAVENVARVSRGYSDLEYNVPKGKRGSRHDLVSELIAELTGAEDAMVVNNNAAATMIVLATIGAGKEIVVSRGELVEIGGAFRIPDIMMQSGAYLQEVGTSNKTKASDYENAIMTREMLEKGDKKANLVWNTMLYQICKMIGEMSCVLCGKVDGILLTGGLLRFPDVKETIEKRCGWIAPISVYPGEMEQEALAIPALKVMQGKLTPLTYSGKDVWQGFPGVEF